jgi:hypothetical protein
MAAEAGDGDPLESLREQLERTQEAARSLAREAAEAAAGAARRPPPAGWASPAGAREAGDSPELAALVGFVNAVREAIPPELFERLVVVVRELLMALRALVDYLLGRMEARQAGPTEVQDIPIL